MRFSFLYIMELKMQKRKINEEQGEHNNYTTNYMKDVMKTLCGDYTTEKVKQKYEKSAKGRGRRLTAAVCCCWVCHRQC